MGRHKYNAILHISWGNLGRLKTKQAEEYALQNKVQQFFAHRTQNIAIE